MLRKIIVFLVYIFNVIVFRVKCVGQENIQNKGADERRAGCGVCKEVN